MKLSPGNVIIMMTSFILVTWLAPAAESSIRSFSSHDLKSLLTQCLSVKEDDRRFPKIFLYPSQSTPLLDEGSSIDCRDVIKKYLSEAYNLQLGLDAPHASTHRALVIKRLRPIDPDTNEFDEEENRQVLKPNAGETGYWRTLASSMDVMRKRNLPDIDSVVAKAVLRLQATGLKAEQEPEPDNTDYTAGSDKHFRNSQEYEPEKTPKMTSSTRAYFTPFLDIKTPKRNLSTETLFKTLSAIIMEPQVNKANRDRKKLIAAMQRDGK